MTSKRTLATAAVAAAFALTATACGGGGSSSTPGSTASGSASANPYAVGNNAVGSVANKSTATGGTLQYVLTDDWDSPDPGNTYYAFSWNFGRNYARTLMTFKNVPGTAGLQAVPDLATGPGVSSDGAKTWTYTIRSGLKYSNGQPIRTQDIKYAIERSNYSPDVLSNGPTYFKDLLGTDYQGAYKDTTPGKQGLSSITTPNDTTIVFHLTQPFAEFDYLATLSQTAPVPASADKGNQYAESMVSSGPYKVDNYTPGKSMTLSKNPYWQASTDPNRAQLADAMNVTLGVDADDIDQRLLSGAIDIDLDGTGVSRTAQATILRSADLKKNADNPLTGFLRYVAINTTIAPLDNLHCRKAIMLAADHTALQTAYGGPVSGDIATTILPPTVTGYAKADQYNFLTNKTGNVAQAKQELQQCGQPNGFSTTVAARSTSPKEVAGSQALQAALKKVGINLTIKTFPSSTYYSNFAGSTSYVKQNGIGLSFAGWGADWPTGYGFLSQFVDGRNIKASGNTNLSQLNDSKVNSLLDQSTTTTDETARNALYTQVDKQVMDDAAILPITYDKALLYRNPRVTNAFVDEAYGMYSYLGQGVSK